MLFNPSASRASRCPGLRPLVAFLPRKIQQIPGVMQGGVGWQGIIPSRAAKMGSIAVDKGIAKLGSPGGLLRAARARQDRRAHPRDRPRRHPRRGRADHGARAPAALARPRPALPRAPCTRGSRSSCRTSSARSTDEIGTNVDQLAGREADGHPPHRGGARAGQPGLPGGGRQGAADDHQLRLHLRLPARASRWRCSPRSSSTRGGCCRSAASCRLRDQPARHLDDLRAASSPGSRARSRCTGCSCAGSRRWRTSTPRSSPTTS